MYYSMPMALPSPISAATPRWDAKTWALLMVLCGVLFLDGLDVSMVGMALPSIRAELGLSTSQLQWVVSGYVLGYGGLLLLGGRAADLLGRRRVLLIALTVFVVASAVGGLVSDGTLLVITRLLKGMSAAFTAPAGLSIITTTFAEGPDRNRALSIYTAFGASGFSFGLVLGGLLTELGWRWVFLLPVPVALAVLIVARRVIPRDPPAAVAVKRRYDVAGAVTITAAMLLLVWTVVEAPESGWASASTVAGFALVATLIASFVTIELRSANPLVRLGILRSASLVRANLGAMALFGGYVGFQFLVTLYTQAALGWSPLETALAFLPAGLLVAFGAPRIGPLVGRFGTQAIIATGMVAMVIGYALFLRIDETPTYVFVMLPTILLIGVGFATAFPSLNIQATAGVENHEQGLASGLVNTSFQLGGAIVLAVVTAVAGGQPNGAVEPSAMLDDFRPALMVVAGVALLGLLVAVSGLVTARRAPAPAYAEG
jgi:MFS family permease